MACLVAHISRVFADQLGDAVQLVGFRHFAERFCPCLDLRFGCGREVGGQVELREVVVELAHGGQLLDGGDVGAAQGVDVALRVVEVGRAVGQLAGVEGDVAAVERGGGHFHGGALLVVIGAQPVRQGHALQQLLRLGIVVFVGVPFGRKLLVGIAEAAGGVHQEDFAAVGGRCGLPGHGAVLADACRRTASLHHHAVGRKHAAVLGVNEHLRMLDLNTCHVLAVLDALHAGKVGGAAHFAPFRAFRKREPLVKTLFNVLDRNVLSTQLLEELSIVPCLQ